MSLLVQIPDKGLVVPGLVFNIPYDGFGGIHHANYMGYQRWYEPFNRISDMTFVLPLSPISFRTMLTRSVANEDVYHLKMSTRPVTGKYFRPYDIVAYGNRYMEGYYAFLDIFSQGSVSRPSFAGENMTRHASPTGLLAPRLSDISSVDGYFPWLNAYTFANRITSDIYTKIGLAADSSHYYAASPRDTREIYDFDSLLQGIKRNSFVSGYFPGVFGWDSHRSEIRALSFTTSADVVTLEYDVHVECFQMPWVMDWHVRKVFAFQPSTPTVLHPEEVVTLTRQCNLSTQYSGYVEVYQGQTFERPDHERVISFLANYVPLRDQLDPTSSSLRSSIRDGGFQHFVNTLEAKFAYEVSRDWNNLLPAAAFSGSAAISNAMNGIDTNSIETVLEIPGMASMVPDVKSAIKILSDVSNFNLSNGTVKSVLDFVTGLQLQESFAWAPSRDLLLNVLPKMSAMISEFGSNRQLTVGYGTFSYQLPMEYGRTESKLMVKSKIVLDMTPLGVLSAFVDLDRLGIAPRFSRIYAVQPLMFVLEWFTGLGKLLERLENTTSLWVLPAYFVHSYTVFSPFTKGELDYLQVSNTDDVSGLKVFNRDVSLYYPPPRSSRHKFGQPQKLPPWQLMASLLYQLLK